MEIKPIETAYRGCRFRSRLEARWAVFFDALNMPWEYEKEGFDLDGIRYLPDFWLPCLRLWVEVKGQEPSDSDWLKIIKLARYSDRPVLVLIGNIDVNSESRYVLAGNNLSDILGGFSEDELKTVASEPTAICTPIFHWAQCPVCAYVCLGFEARNNQFALFCDPCRSARLGVSVKLDKIDPRTTEAMLYAYQSARSARFEQGR